VESAALPMLSTEGGPLKIYRRDQRFPILETAAGIHARQNAGARQRSLGGNQPRNPTICGSSPVARAIAVSSADGGGGVGGQCRTLMQAVKRFAGRKPWLPAHLCDMVDQSLDPGINPALLSPSVKMGTTANQRSVLQFCGAPRAIYRRGSMRSDLKPDGQAIATKLRVPEQDVIDRNAGSAADAS